MSFLLPSGVRKHSGFSFPASLFAVNSLRKKQRAETPVNRIPARFISVDTQKRLTGFFRCAIIVELPRTDCGLVAQLDRVFDYESKGRGFESRRAHHKGGFEGSLLFLVFQGLQRL